MPLENEPDITNLPTRINKITQCVGNSEVVDQSNPAIVINAINFPTQSRDFTNANIPSPSPIPINEPISINGFNQFNCSLYNRYAQSKTLIDREAFLNQFNFNPHLHYGDSEPDIISDYTLPTFTTETSTIPQVSLTDSASVYESAFYFDEDKFFYGVNVLDGFSQLIDLGIINPDTLSPVSPGDLPGYRWVIKNQSSNHYDWTFNHTSTPNNFEYLVFSEDHWWIYDFGVNKKVIGKVKISFSLPQENRHSHIEISGSNDPNIFNEDDNTENVIGDQWVGLGTLWDSLNEPGRTFEADIDNNGLYRWYKLTFKSDGFDNQHDFLMIDEIQFSERTISTVNPVKMSDFYGLHLLETVNTTEFVLTPTPGFVNVLTYNSGHRMLLPGPGDGSGAPLSLGGTYLQNIYLNLNMFSSDDDFYTVAGVGYGEPGVNYAENSNHNILFWNKLNDGSVTHFDIAVTNPLRMLDNDLNTLGIIQLSSNDQTTIMDFVFKSNNLLTPIFFSGANPLPKPILKGLEIKFEEGFGHKEIAIYGTNSEDNEDKYIVGPSSPQSNNQDEEFFTTLFDEESTNTNYGDRTINFNNDTAFCVYRILFKNNSYQNTIDTYAHIKIKSLKWIMGTEII